jgi:hypothetical protein
MLAPVFWFIRGDSTPRYPGELTLFKALSKLDITPYRNNGRQSRIGVNNVNTQNASRQG